MAACGGIGSELIAKAVDFSWSKSEKNCGISHKIPRQSGKSS